MTNREQLEQNSQLIEECIHKAHNLPPAGEAVPEYKSYYQKLSYIQTTTGCRVTTDIYANAETGMELLAKYPVLADRVPMGSRADSGTTRFYIPYPLSTSTVYVAYNTGSSKTVYPAANVVYRATMNFLNSRCAGFVEENTGTAKSITALTDKLTDHPCPIGIFCYLSGENGTIGSSRDFIFYKARISQGDEVVREYLPCYRKSDGEIGLIETFTGAFYPNEGTGTMTMGEEIDW